MSTYVKLFNTLSVRGYPRDKILLLISEAFRLTPEQVVTLARKVKA